MSLTESTEKKKKMSSDSNGSSSLKDHYLDQLPLTPTIKSFLTDATVVGDGKDIVKSCADFSYSASCYAGDHFRLVGDAACE